MARRKTCNDRLRAETAQETGESVKTIDLIMEWQTAFIVRTIQTGTFEAIKVPAFGTFRAKLRQIQVKDYYRGMPKITTRQI